MLASNLRSKVALLSVTVLMVSGFGFAGLAGSLAGAASSATHASATPAVTALGSHVPAAPTAAAASATPNAASAMASAALAATKAAGLKPNVCFVPRPSATSAQLAAAREAGVVSPLYTGSPAPMGLGYYGLSAGPGGKVVGSILNTTSLVATVDTNATGVVANDLLLSSPDSYGIQLNAVVTNVTLFGTPGYSFWTQNVIEFYPQTHFMILITNVWNFSSGPLTTNVFYAHGPYGTQVGTTYYYAELIVPWPVAYPFNLSLYLTSTITDGRNAVDFSVSLSSTTYPAEDFAAPYDYVIFNSLPTSASPPLTQPSNYTANGFAYNPMGLTDDFELIFGGPGGGSQATLFEADATLGLAYWDGTAYVSVPAAYSYGGETGETVTGANVAWSNASGGPFSTYGTMTTGPSFLTGLWNATAPEGSYPVTLAVTPANAFNILNPVGWSANFTVNEAAVAPEAYTNTLYLTPGNYSLLTELSDYAPVTTALDVSGPTTVTITLVPDLAAGVYTPLWAFSNAEVAALAVSGSGTTASPYLMPNDQLAPFSPVFGLYNDWTYGVYPGVFFLNTDVTTEFVSPPSLSTTTNTFAFPGPYMPGLNDLQYWFWNVSNVGLLNATNISGWFGQSAWYPAVWNTFNVVFYEGGGNLVANDTFNSEGQGLVIYAGTGPYLGVVDGMFDFSPGNVGGTNNMVWGNVFNQVLPPVCPLYPKCEPIFDPALGLGLELAAANNTIYNNAFLTPTTAWLLPLNLYSGNPFFYADTFNITVQPATNVHTAPSFPYYELTGSIIGTKWQGGNYWWDYGLAFNPYNGANNPYGILPYDENAPTLLLYVYGPAFYYATYIYPGGDYAPLIPFTLYTVTVTPTGLPAKAVWDLSVVSSSDVLLDNFATNLSSYLIYLPNGTYSYTPTSANLIYAASPGTFTVTGAARTLLLSYQLVTYVVTFELVGTPSKPLAKALAKYGWTVEFNGVVRKVMSTSTSFTATNGTYPYLVAGPSGFDLVQLTMGPAYLPFGGNVTVNGAAVTMKAVLTAGPTDTLKFTEKGLPKTQTWCVELSGWQLCQKGSSASYLNLTPSYYPYAVVSPLIGQQITAAIGTTKLSEPTGLIPVLTKTTVVSLVFVYKYAVTFTETGLPSGGTWSVTVGTLTLSNATGDPITFHLVNGTYSYKIGTETGYKSVGVPPKVAVHGANASVTVTFTKKGKP